MSEPEVKIIEFKPTKHKPEQGLLIVGVGDFPVPAPFRTELPPSLVRLEPGGWGGNHRHQRREIFVGLTEGLWFIWKDVHGQHHEVPMVEGHRLKLFAIAPWVPHLVENRGATTAVMCELMERFDGPANQLEGKESLR